MTPEQFLLWRQSHKWSRRKAAEALGLSAISIYFYEKGYREDGRPVVIPKSVRLAMAAISLGMTDFDGPEIPEEDTE